MDSFPQIALDTADSTYLMRIDFHHQFYRTCLIAHRHSCALFKDSSSVCVSKVVRAKITWILRQKWWGHALSMCLMVDLLMVDQEPVLAPLLALLDAATYKQQNSQNAVACYNLVRIKRTPRSKNCCFRLHLVVVLVPLAGSTAGAGFVVSAYPVKFCRFAIS